MMLVIETQRYENYGDADNQYWKAKGGSSYKITGVPTNVDLDEIVSIVRPQIEKANDYLLEDIIGYGLEADDWLSGFERSQLEYEGSVEFCEPEIEYSEILKA